MSVTLGRRALAEGLGTFFLVFMGCGSIMVAERFPGAVPAGAVPVVFGLVIAVLIYALGHISGAHFNPAVSLGFAAIGRLSKRALAAYCGSQFLGALLGLALLAALLPKGNGYGATLPQTDLLRALSWEAVLTFLLMFVILAVATDERAQGTLAGLAIGGTVTLDAFVGGPLTGASMNPARSLAPALFQGQGWTLWLYFAGPVLGAIGAAFLYEYFRHKAAP